MGTVVNGISIHGGLRAFGATFLVFNDYMRPATRLAALMEAPSIFVYTHDSIFSVRTGRPTNRSEHLASLRAMPNMWVVRPADPGETAEAWELALGRTTGPTSLILTRQAVAGAGSHRPQGGVLHRRIRAARGERCRPGGDRVGGVGGTLRRGTARSEDFGARGFSLPCWEAFFAQDPSYRREVLGDGLPIASLEAATTFGWDRIVGSNGLAMESIISEHRRSTSGRSRRSGGPPRRRSPGGSAVAEGALEVTLGLEAVDDVLRRLFR